MQTKGFTIKEAYKLEEPSYQCYITRLFDIVFSLCAILIFSPLLIIIALMIKLKSPEGAVLFTQKRLGLNGKIFEVYKFRTMVPDAEKKLEELLESDAEIKESYFKFRKLKNDPRIIPSIGNFLRKTSLDELPQFFNVLFGEMSIVGPRPYIPNEFVTNNQKNNRQIILSVKPGVTGYWQTIPERHDETFDFRVEKDVEYIQKRSFLLDMKIILQTVGVMAGRKGL